MNTLTSAPWGSDVDISTDVAVITGTLEYPPPTKVVTANMNNIPEGLNRPGTQMELFGRGGGDCVLMNRKAFQVPSLTEVLTDEIFDHLLN